MRNKNLEKREISRRNFIKSSTVIAGGLTIVPRHVLGGAGFIAPSDQVNVAVVGVGGRGKQNASQLLRMKDVQIIAIADTAEYWNLANFYYRSEAGRGPAKKLIEEHYQEVRPDFKLGVYTDFRKLLENEKDLDAVLCATPDHTHAYVSLTSMREGKHVYCEKPLTHNIWEARMVQKVARESKLATQMGNQLHSTEGIRQCVELLKAGVLGEIKEVHAWVGATRWTTGLKGMPESISTIQDGFNWDLWLGPRNDRQYNEVFTPVTWRDFWEFGCGAMGDFGCHDLDAAVWGLDLPTPESVQLFPAGYSDENITPYGEIGYYQFPSGKGKDPVKLTWYSGGLKPAQHKLLPKTNNLPGRGAMYVGEKGIMLYDGSRRGPKIFPESLDTEVDRNLNSLPPTNGHHQDWIDAIKGGAPASSNFEYGAHLTEISLLGVMSLRLGAKKIYWDAKNMKAIGMPEADRFIQEPVRPGWEMI